MRNIPITIHSISETQQEGCCKVFMCLNDKQIIRYPANVRICDGGDAGEGQLRWCGGMLYVRARGAATPRVAPHRPGPASTTARSWDADLQRTQLHYSIVSYSIPPTLGSRDEEMRRAGAGAACSGWNAGTRRLFWWKLSAASQPELWRGRRAEPGRRRPARQHRHRHHQPPHRALIGHNSRIMLL